LKGELVGTNEGSRGPETVEGLLIRKEFRDVDTESTKVGELRTMEQGNAMCEEHVQRFRKVARGSSYKGRALIEEFQRSINSGIRRRLMESEDPLEEINEWYLRAIKLDCH